MEMVYSTYQERQTYALCIRVNGCQKKKKNKSACNCSIASELRPRRRGRYTLMLQECGVGGTHVS